MIKTSKPQVVVAMSGGVDSSLAAFLLSESGEKGYEVIGITLKLWDSSEVGGDLYKDGRCCSLEAMNDARNVCQKLGIPHYVLDFKEKFKDRVINNFVEEYKKGRTPNPCIVCNTEIKWKLLWGKAKELGAEFLATGHYARIKYSEKEKRFLLLKGVDPHKDQSYALWGLSQENLSKTIFPLGELTKKEVRELAKKYNLKTAFKEESQEICFVPDDDYERFLKEWTITKGKGSQKELNQINRGPIYDLKKNKIGEHKGIPFYTIGQRRGLKIALGKPLYVVKIYPDENAIYVGENKDLFKTTFIVSNLNWIYIPELKDKLNCLVKIRYLHSPAKAEISPFYENIGTGLVEQSKIPLCGVPVRKVKVEFEKPERAITPGQSAVFYEGEKVIGGGVIEKVEE
ncbi:MAG: tRNA 2-thiouridine(34) synthase MnmA [candidate division Zixibacteria bacterium]|nr:tRNA 2-thiouridine(34) synthase MnmA [candidate division Zixibacteria bacterium]